MSEEKELEKYVVTISLVYCPKAKKVVDTTIWCVACPFFKGQDWSKVLCAYKEER